VQLDAVRDAYFDEGVEGPAPEKELAVIRLVTTSRRLGNLAAGPLKAGDWVHLVVSRRKKRRPRAVFFNVREGRFVGEGARPLLGSLVSIDRLPRRRERLPKSLSSAAAPAAQQKAAKAAALRKRYHLSMLKAPKVNTGRLSAMLSRSARGLTQAIALDVGQASFCVLGDGRMPKFYFDVGQPIWGHLKGLPPRRWSDLRRTASRPSLPPAASSRWFTAKTPACGRRSGAVRQTLTCLRGEAAWAF
jgi:hypothetical protein